MEQRISIHGVDRSLTDQLKVLSHKDINHSTFDACKDSGAFDALEITIGETTIILFSKEVE